MTEACKTEDGTRMTPKSFFQILLLIIKHEASVIYIYC